MKEIVLDLRSKTLLEKIEFSGDISTGLAKYPTIFTAPNPTVADLTGTTNSVVSKLMERNNLEQQLHAANVELGVLEATLDSKIGLEANYVQRVSNGDESIIAKAGMKVKKQGSPIGELPKVTNLSASIGDGRNEIDLHWNKVYAAKSYTIEMAEASGNIDNLNWIHSGVSTKSRFTVKGLTSGKAMLFRVAAVGAAGQGNWNSTFAIYVP